MLAPYGAGCTALTARDQLAVRRLQHEMASALIGSLHVDHHLAGPTIDQN